MIYIHLTELVKHSLTEELPYTPSPGPDRLSTCAVAAALWLPHGGSAPAAASWQQGGTTLLAPLFSVPASEYRSSHTSAPQ
jgi:hypothetical protein